MADRKTPAAYYNSGRDSWHSRPGYKNVSDPNAILVTDDKRSISRFLGELAIVGLVLIVATFAIVAIGG